MKVYVCEYYDGDDWRLHHVTAHSGIAQEWLNQSPGDRYVSEWTLEDMA